MCVFGGSLDAQNAALIAVMIVRGPAMLEHGNASHAFVNRFQGFRMLFAEMPSNSKKPVTELDQQHAAGDGLLQLLETFHVL